MSPPHAVNFRLVILLMVLLALALIAGQVSQHGARNRPLATVMTALILLGVGLAMAACGGGGNTTARHKWAPRAAPIPLQCREHSAQVRQRWRTTRNLRL